MRDFYDVVAQTCLLDPLLARQLGFRRVFVSNTDLRVEHVDLKIGQFGAAIAFGSDKKRLYEHARNGTRALAIADSGIDLKLLDSMADNRTILCLALNNLVSSYNFDLAKQISRTRNLVSRAQKYKIPIAVVSLAQSRINLCSTLQLLELAKLLGLEERYARYSLGEVNKSLCD